MSLAATGARIVCCWLLVLCNQLLLPDCTSYLLVESMDWMMPAAQACLTAGSGLLHLAARRTLSSVLQPGQRLRQPSQRALARGPSMCSAWGSTWLQVLLHGARLRTQRG